MICRIRFDIGWRDLAYGLLAAARPNRVDAPAAALETTWRAGGDGLACLSVRSCFDLALRALAFAPGDEVILTAVTIPHIVDILRHHGLVPVPVDLDADTLAPLRPLDEAVTPRTRAILVAHLFGTRVPMDPICALARRHDLVVIEDCAQAFDGLRYQGHDDTDVAMFSFGSIKHGTSLGGALARVRSPALRARMQALHAAYPLQSQRGYLAKLLRYAVLQIGATRLVFTLLVALWRTLGVDYDAVTNATARGFTGGDFFTLIRRRPCAGLLRLMHRRLVRTDDAALRRHRVRCDGLVAALLPGAPRLGHRSAVQTHWLFPVRVRRPDDVVDRLRGAGFDATRYQSALVVVPPPPGRPAATSIAAALGGIVYLPAGPQLGDRDLVRLVAVMRAAAGDDLRTAPTPAHAAPVIERQPTAPP